MISDVYDAKELAGWAPSCDAAEERALDWITAHLHFFDPMRQKDVKSFRRVIKPLAELALTCGIANNNCTQHKPKYEKITDFVWSLFSMEPVREYLLKYAAGSFAFSIYSSLYRCGFEHAVYRSRLSDLLLTGYPLSVERLPFVKLNLAYNVEACKLPWRGPDMHEIYKSSLLASHPNIYDLESTDAYAVTHILFFLTDFARRSSPVLLTRDYAYFGVLLPRLLEYYLGRRNWDLTSEMLVCLKSVGLETVPVFNEAWALLLAFQNTDGSFDGGDISDVAKARPDTSVPVSGGDFVSDAGKSERDYFFRNYHTTLVALLSMNVSPPTV